MEEIKLTSGYITFDPIDLSTGTKCFFHEIQALKEVTNLKFVIARSYPGNDVNFIKMTDFEKWYSFNPYLADYFVAQLIPEKVDFLHLACSPAQAILNRADPKKYVTHIIAHDLKMSIEEHERMYGIGSYQFIHNTDPYLHSLLLKHADNATAVVTASTPASKWIYNNTKAKKVVSIPHGCEVPENVFPFPEKFTLGYLGVFGPDKGLPYLFLAWKYFDNVNSELLFAGNCCTVLAQDNFKNMFLKDLTKYRLLGRVKEISDFYNNISVYVQPSVTEGFGIEIPEAMAYGRPVIVTNTTGSMDLVDEGVNGFIIPPRDPLAILEKIRYFNDNPGVMRKMGDNAREKMKDFTWKKIHEKYIKFYQEVLS